MKSYLGKLISKEQFSFLPDRKITDVVGLFQELLHSINVKKNTAFCLKLDFMKAYNRVDWSYLRLILIQIGLPPDMVEWIVMCVSSTHFAMLINGVPSGYFKGNGGIRQGFLLSPYLFLLAIEGLSLLIRQTKIKRLFSGLRVSRGYQFRTFCSLMTLSSLGVVQSRNGNTFRGYY